MSSRSSRPARARPVSPAVRAPRRPVRAFPRPPGRVPPYGRSVHSEHASGAGKHGAGEFADSGYGERAETYLRLLAESALRADTDVRADDVRRAADILVDAGVLSHEQSSQIVDGMQLALRVRGRPTARTATWRLQRLSSYSSGQPTAGQPTAGKS